MVERPRARVGSVVLGVDGCPGGWYAARRDEAGGEITGRVYRHFRELLDDAPVSAIIAVDIPIGLLDAGSRPCDVAARHALAPVRGSSVFPAPLRPMLAVATHAEASAVRRAVEGKGMSIQAFGILRKVAEVDRVLRERPTRAGMVYEVHPELSLATMNGGAPVRAPKKSPDGRLARTALLARTFGNGVERLLADRERVAAGADDVLDAVAALWTAVRIGDGLAQRVPTASLHDAHGLRMAIHH